MEKQKRVIFSVGLKLIFIISLIFTLSFTVMIYLATTLFKKDMTAFIENNNHKISIATSQSTEIYVKNIIEKGYIAAGNLIASKKTEIETSSENPLFLSQNDDIIYMALIEKNSEGVLVNKRTFTSTEFFGESGIDREKVESFSDTLSSDIESAFNLNVNMFNPSPEFGYPLTGLAIPYRVIDEKNAQSILFMLIKTGTLQNIVQMNDITTTYIVSDKGVVLIHPDMPEVLAAADISSLSIYEDFHKNPLDNGQKRYDENGVLKIGSYQRINFSGFALGVITTVTQDRAFDAVIRLQRRNIMTAIIIITAVIMFIYFYSKTITTPVRNLVRATKQVEKGNYQISLKPLFNDEIGMLARAFNNMSQGLEERERIKDAFGKFVNPEIAERVTKEQLTLGGEMKNAAVFFSDIRSFTAISEKLHPEKVVEFLNEYMTLMVDCIDQTHGVVDKFIGDAIMALWGTPVSRGNDTENAINAALMMRLYLKEFNKTRGSDEKPVIRIGCGINTGPLIAGQIGSANRMEYTVIGDTVNLASRIEALNKPFQTDILISEASYNLVKDIFIFEPMKKITVKGKTQPQQIYAVINRKDAPDGPRNLSELRHYMGLEDIDINLVDSEGNEEKFKILD
ncbi:MAG: HAMP domain-containing protein [Spirochaetes bacterium]|nr:HAMP domain-containing protein [Spirochaetota bacterium]MBN2770575.1 HAMP domain-containing protein [Spirochaetota bacterium]